MKSFTSTILVVSVLAGPAFSFAHGPDDPVAPERPRHERIGIKDMSYDAGGYGGVAAGSAAGGPSMGGRRTMMCDGPSSFCNLYFGH
jgi:hypothetical protein